VKTVLSAEAIEDLRDGFDFIAKDSPAAARTFLLRILGAFDLLSSGIIRGRRATLPGRRHCHAWSVPPYWIYHVLAGRELRILRVYHQARRPIDRRGL